MSQVEAIKIVKKYAAKLKKEKFPFSTVYLFGSYAKGNPKKTSDIDVAVVSDMMKKNWNENEDKLWRYTIGINSKIEPIGFTVAEFKSNIDPMSAEIKKTGIKVA